VLSLRWDDALFRGVLSRARVCVRARARVRVCARARVCVRVRARAPECGQVQQSPCTPKIVGKRGHTEKKKDKMCLFLMIFVTSSDYFLEQL